MNNNDSRTTVKHLESLKEQNKKTSIRGFQEYVEDYATRLKNDLEVREKIRMDQDFYEKNWQRSFQIRIGISHGFANVGFYGSKKYFQTYTAIGPVVNLAARLCSAANPDQMVIDHDVFELVQNNYKTNFIGKKSLKGFDEDIFHLYEVIANNETSTLNPGVSECPKCSGIINLEVNDQGHFVFMCKSCCSVIENPVATPIRAAS